jgi:hypothetical protein
MNLRKFSDAVGLRLSRQVEPRPNHLLHGENSGVNIASGICMTTAGVVAISAVAVARGNPLSE